MHKEQILAKLKEIFKMVVNNGVEVDNIKEDANIMLDLGVNSIGLLYMAIAIEKEFDVDMADVSPSSFKTVSDVIAYIEEHQK